MIYYRRGPRGITTYEIFPFEEGYMSIWGYENGAQQEKFTEVFENESGRTHAQQVKLEIASKVKRLKDKGYHESREAALAGKDKNAMGLYRPMLATKYKDHIIAQNDLIQYKYDGHRCLMYNDGQDITAYSRNGTVITTVSHISAGVDIPVGTTLDGELYVHGRSLQSITSLIKRQQAGSADLRYIVYDVVSDECYSKRYEMLREFGLPPAAEIAPSWRLGDTSLSRTLEGARADGYEGIMIRKSGVGYAAGRRSQGLIKVKQWDDEEFMIVNVLPSKDGWAILDFGDFSATAPGAVYEKAEILRNKSNYIGKMARVEYAKLTDDGVPFHPIVTNIID